jgi:tetratricopeptide (TPR) repeat protein
MKGYTTREVESLIGLSRRHAREYGRSGVLDPHRGPGNRYLFSFQDLVLLRTAKALLDDDVPQRRILRALRHLKEQLPRDRSLTELRIEAEGDEVVARDDERAWDPESGQLRFTFDVAELAARVEPLAQRAVAASAPEDSTVDWLELGIELETHAPAQARRAYEKVLELDPGHVDALVNLGRLLHEDGELEPAIVHYRRALDAAGGDEPTAAFNLGLALEDLGRDRAASDAYRAALTIDPGFADAHYNLSRVYERLGDRLSALRHLKSYRTLTAGTP